MRLLRNAMIPALLLLATGVYASSPIKVDANVYPSVSLPGRTPFVEIQVTNVTDTPVAVANYARLLVRSGGKEFAARFGGLGLEQGIEGAFMFQPVLLPAGETVSGVFGSGDSFYENGWAFDSRLNEPGSQEWIMETPWAELNDEDLAYVRETDDVEIQQKRLRFAFMDAEKHWVQSPPMHHEVSEPRGIDREVWLFMRTRTDGPWSASNWTPALAAEMLSKYPWSGYTPEALAVVPALDMKKFDNYVETAIEEYPDDVLTPLLAIRLYALKRQEAFESPDVHRLIRGANASSDVLANALDTPLRHSGRRPSNVGLPHTPANRYFVNSTEKSPTSAKSSKAVAREKSGELGIA